MTIEEALTEIKERIHITEYVGSNYVDCVNIEALRMAIEALKNSERKAESAQNVQNDDLISRKAAIDALGDEPWACTETKYKLGMQAQWESDVETLKNLPSVQPEIIRCKDCIYQTESWSGIKYCEAHGDHIGKDYDYCSNARRKDNG